MFLGSGVPRDRERAIEYLSKAVSQGHAQAHTFLGCVLFRGSEEERKTGVHYWQQGAELGDAAAMCKLGELCI